MITTLAVDDTSVLIRMTSRPVVCEKVAEISYRAEGYHTYGTNLGLLHGNRR
ncbi:MAG TPA: hypothetical protein VL361_04730 [Candidatus Limnocylindrales bacterium]|nr:hypothetical protein [Candidatus Limnocylindrales bacterium]